MIHRHQPAQEMQIDFAGDKLSWVDTHTGEIHSCPVLICTLPFSGFAFLHSATKCEVGISH